jgi:FemAB-related protein (PEP-CTERM system-associated)
MTVASELQPSVEFADDRARPLSVTVATTADGRAWDAFVASQSGATGCHAWAWREVFHQAFGHECVYVIARDGSRIVGVLPLVQINSRLFGRTLTSLPFLTYGGIVAIDATVAARLIDEARAQARTRRCRHVELRHRERRFPELPCRQHKVAMRLELRGVTWETLDRKVRNQIRKAQKSGLTISRGGAELVGEFYAVFARNMRDLGTPVHAPTLFAQVLATFPDQARLHVVRLDGRPIAAGLTYHSRRMMEIPWASSVRDFNALCPNHLLYWSVLQFAMDMQCDQFDFGRSTPGEGTFKFKEQWGARPLPLHWEYVVEPGTPPPTTGPADPRFATAIEVWKRLPLGVANRLGPYIVRGIP